MLTHFCFPPTQITLGEGIVHSFSSSNPRSFCSGGGSSPYLCPHPPPPSPVVQAAPPTLPTPPAKGIAAAAAAAGKTSPLSLPTTPEEALRRILLTRYVCDHLLMSNIGIRCACSPYVCMYTHCLACVCRGEARLAELARQLHLALPRLVGEIESFCRVGGSSVTNEERAKAEEKGEALGGEEGKAAAF